MNLDKLKEYTIAENQFVNEIDAQCNNSIVMSKLKNKFLSRAGDRLDNIGIDGLLTAIDEEFLPDEYVAPNNITTLRLTLKEGFYNIELEADRLRFSINVTDKDNIKYTMWVRTYACGDKIQRLYQSCVDRIGTESRILQDNSRG